MPSTQTQLPSTMGRLPLLDRLQETRRVLLAGAGGGCDILSAIPLYRYLQAQGKTVFLASLSFADLPADRDPRRNCLKVDAQTPVGGDGYFPEVFLCRWFAEQGESVEIYCYKTGGARALLSIYQELVRELDLDALVLVDGGTDSLMRGDEPSLGTPAEDMCSLAAAHMLDLPVRLMVNLGFGVDTHHGVCHAYVLEAVADLTRSGDFLGAFSLLPPMPEFQAYIEAVNYINACMPGRESIVASSVSAAGQGYFGNHHPTPRTRASTMFINPLMSMYWCFEVDGVAQRCLYMDYLKETYSRWDVHRAISNYLFTVKADRREWMDLAM